MKISARSQWLALNRVSNSYKVLSSILAVALVVNAAVTYFVASRPPVVIEKRDESQKRYSSRRQDIPITKEEIQGFVKEFIKIHYEWESNKQFNMVKGLIPIATEDFIELVRSKFKKEKRPQELFSQYVGNIKVSVTDKDVVAQFDRIIRLKGIPLLSVTQISLQIIKASPNEWNPLGLYVNGLIEHEAKQ